MTTVYEVAVYSGTTEWRLDGLTHRENGPAIEYADGSKEYWIDGLRHRENGPAVEYADGGKEYWLHGVKLTEQEFISKTATLDGKVAEIDGKKYKLTLV